MVDSEDMEGASGGLHASIDGRGGDVGAAEVGELRMPSDWQPERLERLALALRIFGLAMGVVSVVAFAYALGLAR